MKALRVLFIGGTGTISSACAELALQRGMELYLLTRGQSARPIPKGAHILAGDIKEPGSAEGALEGMTFDAVVNWIAYTPDRIEADLNLFRGRIRQYVFISSAAVYRKPVGHLPITESTPLANPFWSYARNKIACEERLWRAVREENFPVTIVRPAHTYDERCIPLEGGWTGIERMRQGKDIVIHGDGTTRWVLTHNTDFAKGLVGLLGHVLAIGDVFHITSDEALTWNQIVETLAAAAGIEPRVRHLSSEIIAAYNSWWGDSLLGDKAHSVLFDNSKIKRIVPDFQATLPFAVGARQIVAWHDADSNRRRINPDVDTLFDQLVAAHQASLPRK